jgi:U3 small nucleolar RNA-associated protein 3
LEPSDEDILGYSSESEDDDTELAPTKAAGVDYSDDDKSVAEEEEEEEGWGTSKKDYYNNDAIETEMDAREEEEEARRLQQKKLQNMTDADFGFDESEWLDTVKDDHEDGDVVTEVLKEIEITPKMSQEERLRLLQTRYPEFEFLANDFLQLEPVLQDLQEQAAGEKTLKGQTSVTTLKCRALAAYTSSLSMYFALLTSPARSSPEKPHALDAAELRDHPIMDSLLKCRSVWTKVKDLKAPAPAAVLSESESDDDVEMVSIAINDAPQETRVQKQNKSKSSTSTAKANRLLAAESDLASLSSLMPQRGLKTSGRASKAPQHVDSDSASDFGEAEALTARGAAEKAQRKKSLRFYTSQIAQKTNRRAIAGRDAGGDEDLPYRERFRDRQMRLNAEAERRGKKMDEYGRGNAALGGSEDEGDEGLAKQVRGDEDEYYDMIAQTGKEKKRVKEEKGELIKKAKAENKMVRIVEGEVGGDGKRAIGYVIEKNKGLAPKRKKEVRNPRLKKRMKYEQQKKKLASMKATYKGGEERGGYGGEKTGIKTGLVKSIKL